VPAVISPPKAEVLLHAALVRVTHWITVLCFFALLISGAEIVVSHPRFYWGEVGNVNTRPLFTIPIPSSRGTVPTGYNFVMTDENGWSRYLHFQTAWALVLTGLIYVIVGLWSGHFRRDLLPEPGNRTWRAYWGRIAQYLRRAPPDAAEERSYNVL
jgi:thiosulfate reductase cytochrome b subunit